MIMSQMRKHVLQSQTIKGRLVDLRKGRGRDITSGSCEVYPVE
jgi:hypothetical protein